MKYGFIGCGNMGGALALALSKTTKDILLADADRTKSSVLALKLGVKSGDNIEVIEKCDRVFFGVKPQVMGEMIKGIKTELDKKGTTVITMAAGVEIKKIEEYIGFHLPIIRIMPNTPVSVGKGVVLYCYNDLVSKKKIEDFKEDMKYAGFLAETDEKLMDAGCSLSGCGPAFMYMFVDALARGAEACGLSRENAVKYAAATMSGSAEMVLKSGLSPEQLKINVCSPGGSTIEGVKVLEEAGLYKIGENAVKAAYKRNLELGK